MDAREETENGLMDRRKSLALFAVVALLIGMTGLAVWTFRSVRKVDPSSLSVRGWLLREGELGPLSGDGLAEVLDDARLERDRVTINLPTGSQLRFPTENRSNIRDSKTTSGHAKKPTALPLPQVQGGEMSVDADVPVKVEGRVLSPKGSTRFVVNPIQIVVVRGLLSLRGREVRKGGTIQIGGKAISDATPEESFEAPSPEESVARTATPPEVHLVVDAADDTPIAGVRIHVTFSHTDEGYPPLPMGRSREVVTSDARGRFELPLFRPFDPRVRVHLETEHESYLPVVHVVEDEPGVYGNRPPVTLALRRSVTEFLTFQATSGETLSGLALRVRVLSRDPFIGEDAWEGGRSVRPGQDRLRYTKENGRLQIGSRPIEITVMDPLLHFWMPSERNTIESITLDPVAAVERARGPYPWNEIHLKEGDARQYTLVDRNRIAVAETLVEVELEDMPSVRFYTKGDGSFFFAPRPQDYAAGIPVFHEPRPGTLTTLSPLAWRHVLPVEMPDRSSRLQLSGKMGSDLRMRLVEFVDDDFRMDSRVESQNREHFEVGGMSDAVRAVVSDEIFLGCDMTLVHRDPEAQLVFQGVLPDGQEDVFLAVKGFLPEMIRFPRHLPEEEILELEDIPLERGKSVTLRVREGSVPESLLSRARLIISDESYPEARQSYPFSGERSIRISGLEPGHSYAYSVEGPRVRSYRGVLSVTEELLEVGEDVRIESSGERWTLLRGRVLGVRAEDCHLYRVIERYYDTQGGAPRTYHSYPLREDGTYGSARVVKRPYGIEVFVSGPGREFAHTFVNRSSDAQVFEAVNLRIRDAALVRLSFEAEGLGVVRPPEKLSLRCQENDYHELVQLEVRDWGVELNKILPGHYTLSWPDPGDPGSFESYEFFMGKRGGVIERVVPRQMLTLEELPFRVIDEEGRPVTAIGLQVLLPDGSEREPNGPEVSSRELRSPSGRYSVLARPREATRLRIEADGLVPVELSVAPMRPLPDPIVMLSAVAVRGRVLDVHGGRFDGVLDVHWEPLPSDVEGLDTGREDVVYHTVPFSVRVRHGLLESDLFPPGVYEFRLDDVNSAAAVREILELTASRNNIASLRLKETRRLVGTVFFPDRERAAGARVSLVRPEGILRFPGRDLSSELVEYSVRADGVGRFEIDGLPLDFREDLALVAHLDGWTDAIEYPMDLEADEHDLVIDANTSLHLNLGYRSLVPSGGFAFRLRYLSPHSEGEDWTDLGSVEVPERGGLLYRGISPGVYELVWDLVEPHPQFVSRSQATAVEPGVEARLVLQVDDHFLTGRARFNGVELERGWVLLTPDPGDQSTLRTGRVRDGSFVVPLPRSADRAFVSLIPERTPLPMANFERGEALPREVENFRQVVKDAYLEVDYFAYDLTVEFPAGIAENHPDLEAHFPHFEFGRRGELRVDTRREELRSSTFRLFLLRPGPFSLRVSSSDGLRYLQNFELRRDLSVSVSDR